MNEDRASRYHRLQRRAAIASTIAGAGWLIALVVTRASAALARTVSAAAAAWPSPISRAGAIVLFVTIVVAGYEAVTLPFTVFRFRLERKYGLSSEALRTWAFDHLKAFALGLGLTAGAAGIVFLSVALSGPWWWLSAAALFVLAGIALSNLAPIVLMPLFYRFRPLQREELRDRLVRLSDRAGVKVLGAFEWGLGAKTSRANAALVGLGRTRRIIVSDTLLNDYSDDEIEVILAHEIAHHVYYDIWSSLAIEGGVLAAALLTADLAVRTVGARFAIDGPSDLAALPVMAIATGLVSMLLRPFGNAWSRHNERRADRFALSLTRRPDAFISAMRRLGTQNLAEERPSSAAFWFFHTHPTIDERIAAAKRQQSRLLRVDAG